jgi:predicted deacylase
MNILDTTILPGETKTISLSIAKLHTGTPIDIPVVVARGEKEGPSLLLTGGIHGDEINGVEIVRQIITKGYHKPTFGTVICMPVINVFGFLNQSREFPDGRDLNRMFPGFKKGSLASRFAYHITQIIKKNPIDYCIDFHTGGGDRFNYSQIRIDATDEETLDLAKAFGSKFILNSQNRDKSFRKTVGGLGKKVLLFEGGKTLSLDRIVTQVGIEGTLKVMQHLGMRNFEKELQDNIAIEKQILIEKSSWVRASESGMWRSFSSIGSYVEKGAAIGSISDPYGQTEQTVKAPFSGYIICNNHAPLVNQGDAISHISKVFDYLD